MAFWAVTPARRWSGTDGTIPPQWLADRFGWETMVATIGGVYNRASRQREGRSVIFTGNYGEAGAVDFFGAAMAYRARLAGTTATSFGDLTTVPGRVVVAVGVDRANLLQAFSDVTQAGTITCQYCMPEEDNLPVLVGTTPTAPIQAIWPTTKHFN